MIRGFTREQIGTAGTWTPGGAGILVGNVARNGSPVWSEYTQITGGTYSGNFAHIAFRVEGGTPSFKASLIRDVHFEDGTYGVDIGTEAGVYDSLIENVRVNAGPGMTVLACRGGMAGSKVDRIVAETQGAENVTLVAVEKIQTQPPLFGNYHLHDSTGTGAWLDNRTDTSLDTI